MRLQLALGRPVDWRPALLAGDLQRLLVLEEVAAVLAAALGRPDLAPALLLALALAVLAARRRSGERPRRPPRPPRHASRPRAAARRSPRLRPSRCRARRLLELRAHAGRQLRRLGPGPGARAVVGLARRSAGPPARRCPSRSSRSTADRDRRSCRAPRARAGRRACRARCPCSRSGGRDARRPAASGRSPLQLSHMRCGALGVGLPARQASSWSLRVQVQVFLQPDVRQRTSRSAIAPKSALHLSHIRRGGSLGRPVRVGLDLLVSAGQLHLLSQPLMPQRTGRSFSLRKTPSHWPQRSVGSGGSTSGAPASSCARRENTDVRVQPGTAHGMVLSASAASSALVSRRTGRPAAGRLVANASICCATLQVHVPLQPGAIAGPLGVLRPSRTSSRQGSHIDDAGSAGLAAPRPPSFAPLADAIEIQVRVQPGTEQGDDFAPSRSASVNPARPMRGLMLTKHRPACKRDVETVHEMSALERGLRPGRWRR